MTVHVFIPRKLKHGNINQSEQGRFTAMDPWPCAVISGTFWQLRLLVVLAMPYLVVQVQSSVVVCMQQLTLEEDVVW